MNSNYKISTTVIAASGAHAVMAGHAATHDGPAPPAATSKGLVATAGLRRQRVRAVVQDRSARNPIHRLYLTGPRGEEVRV